MKAVSILFSSVYLLLVLLLSSGCAAYKDRSDKRTENDDSLNGSLDYDNSITEKYWKLTEVMDKAIIVSDTGEPYLILKTERNRIIGYGGCNTLSGTYTLSEQNEIIFSGLVTTDRVCPDMETENSLLKVLHTASSYCLNGDTLLLNSSKGTFLAEFKAVYLN